jgi:two-component system, NtrC family, response regulator AtoC
MPGTLTVVPKTTAASVRLLLVTRESAILSLLWSIGERRKWHLESATNGWGAMERVQSGVTPDLLILDLPRADGDGLHFLRWLRRLRPELPILALCHQDDVATQQEAIRLGARDCVIRPVEIRILQEAIEQQLATSDHVGAQGISSEDVEQVDGKVPFVGASPIMRKLREQVESVAETDHSVLITGESGSGRQTIARLIHQLSIRSGFGFAKVNCAALPSDLLEAELFGHDTKGNGLSQLKTGKLEMCNKGTILLDEITEMPLTLQSKLIGLVQTGKFARPGSGSQVHVNVRVLTTSTNNLEPAIADNKLREDLLYRLTTYTVRVPPLRERREEIPLLLHYFMRRLSKQYVLSPRPFSSAVLEACQAHYWPGNLREMENFVKGFLLAGGKELPFGNEFRSRPICSQRAASGQRTVPAIATLPGGDYSGTDSLKALVQNVKLEAEKNAIAAALERTGWNRKAAARLLKVSYRTLLYKIEQYQMRSPDSSPMQGGPAFRSSGNGFGGDGRAQ